MVELKSQHSLVLLVTHPCACRPRNRKNHTNAWKFSFYLQYPFGHSFIFSHRPTEAYQAHYNTTWNDHAKTHIKAKTALSPKASGVRPILPLSWRAIIYLVSGSACVCVLNNRSYIPPIYIHHSRCAGASSHEHTLPPIRGNG